MAIFYKLDKYDLNAAKEIYSFCMSIWKKPLNINMSLDYQSILSKKS